MRGFFSLLREPPSPLGVLSTKPYGTTLSLAFQRSATNKPSSSSSSPSPEAVSTSACVSPKQDVLTTTARGALRKPKSFSRHAINTRPKRFIVILTAKHISLERPRQLLSRRQRWKRRRRLMPLSARKSGGRERGAGVGQWTSHASLEENKGGKAVFPLLPSVSVPPLSPSAPSV